jgi:histidyl-tRNA synthetase
MFGVMREACQRFGYEEYDASILEPLDLYTAKTSEEIVREQSYNFEDRGGRLVVMRPEMTPTVSRMVAARRQELGYPLRLFSIPNCFRYERPQRGRMREFWQLNADLFGISGPEADIEIIQLADSIMKAYGADESMYEIKLNSRKGMEELLEARGFSADIAPSIIILLDKLEKPGLFDKELAKYPEKTQADIRRFVDDMEGHSAALLDLATGKNLKNTVDHLRRNGVPVTVDLSVNRGFDYYTDIVFEVFDKNPENNRSMFGGGRYDGLVGLFGVDPVPTVGFGMGDVTLMNFLDSHGLSPNLSAATQMMVIPHGDSYAAAQQYIDQLRNSGVNVAIDPTDRKIGAKFRAAEKLGISYVVVIGDDELKTNVFVLKNLKDGKEQKLSIEQISTFLTKN